MICLQNFKAHAVQSTPSLKYSAWMKACRAYYATNSTTPPASLILISAFRDTYRAFTMMGVSGRRPFPRTFVYPWSQLAYMSFPHWAFTSARVSMTGAVSFVFPRNFSRISSGTSVQSLSRFTEDFQTLCDQLLAVIVEAR